MKRMRKSNEVYKLAKNQALAKKFKKKQQTI
jgi:hypothetical protein